MALTLRKDSNAVQGSDGRSLSESQITTTNKLRTTLIFFK